MVCMNDYVKIRFKCGYEPCQYEEDLLINKHEIYCSKARQCPKCKVWSFKHPRLEFPVTPGLMEALKVFKKNVLTGKKSI